MPKPEIFFGSIQEIADKTGVSYRSACSLLDVVGYTTKRGFRRMSPEEESQYYEPPKPPKPSKKASKSYNSKRHWKLTFFKDWKKGDPYPKDVSLKFSGNPQDFVRFSNCNAGQVYRLINTHEAIPEKYPLRSIKGWTIARVRRYEEPQKRTPRKKKDLADA